MNMAAKKLLSKAANIQLHPEIPLGYQKWLKLHCLSTQLVGVAAPSSDI